MEEDTTNVDATQGESSTPEKGETVPIDRFNAVYKEAKEGKEAKEELETLKAKPAEPGTETPEQQKEAQAEQYLGNLMDKKLDERDKAKVDATAKEDKDFKESVDNTLSIHTDVKREEFLKFVEDNSEKYGFQNVDHAMNIYRDINKLTEETIEKTKENMQEKPSFPKTEAAPGGESVFNDSGKTLQQIAEEASRQAENT